MIGAHVPEELEDKDVAVVEPLLWLGELVGEFSLWLAEALGESSSPVSAGGPGGGLGGGNPSNPATPPPEEHRMAITQPVFIHSGLSQL